MTLTTEHRYVNPWTWQDAFGYAQGVVVPAGQRTLYAAGQTSMSAEGVPMHLGDMAAQARLVLENVETVLAEAGMCLADVVRWDVYTTDLQRYFEHAHGHVVGTLGQDGRFPAGGIATQVTALAVPGIELEVVVTACR